MKKSSMHMDGFATSAAVFSVGNIINNVRALVCALVLIFAGSAQAATDLYWSGNGTTLGGAGTWDTTLIRWGTTTSSFPSAWTNANNDIAHFGATAGTVTLGANIDVGGLWFDTTAYTITTTGYTLNFGAANNTIRLGNIALATITGPVGGTGNVILTAANPAIAATLTLNSTGNGWSGTTTVNAGMTLDLNDSTALKSTSGISINGGRIYVRSTGSSVGLQVSETAAITFNGGGTYEQRHNTALKNTHQILGDVIVSSGQANFLFNNATSSGNNDITLTSFTRSVNTATVNFGTAYSGASLNNKYAVSGVGTTTAGEIIGAWATSGATGANQTDYAVYSFDAVIGAGIVDSAQSTWSTTHDMANNYTLTNASGSAANGLLTATRNINSLRNTTAATAATAINGGAANLDYYTLAGNTFANGDVVSVSGTSGTTAGLPYYIVNVGINGADTFQISTTPDLITPTLVNLGNTTAGQIAGGVTLPSGFNLGTDGILNGSTIPLIIGGSAGVVTLPTTASGNLFVTAGAGAIAIDAPITDNGAGVLSLVKSGNSALRLSGTNTFTGEITINAGTLTFSSLATGMDGTGKNITFGGVGTLDTGLNGWDGGQLSVASGAVGTIAGRTTDFASTTGSGLIIHQQGNAFLHLGDASAFTGSIRKDAGGDGGGVQFSALSDAAGAGNLIFAGGSGNSNQRITMRYSGTSALTFDNRSIELQPKPLNWSFRNAILENNSTDSAHTWVINTDLINQNDRNHEFTLSGSNTGDNEFAGVIGNSTRGTLYTSPSPSANGPELNLYKSGTGKWIVSRENTFTGRILVNQGTLSVGNITDSGVAGALGMGSVIQLGGSDRYFIGANNALLGSNNSGTLEYTGGVATSDRVFEIGGILATGTGGGGIDNDGTGALIFSAANFNSTITGITVTRTLTLGGTNTDNNEIQGIIQDNVAGTGKISLTKKDVGTWTLSGASTYTGSTYVNQGTLLVNNTTGSGTGTGTVIVQNTATLGGSGTVGGAVTVNSGASIQLGMSGNTLTLASATAPSYSSGAILKVVTGATPGTLDKVSASATIGNSVADVDLEIDVTGLSGSVSSSTIYAAGGVITGPFRSVTVIGNTDYLVTLDYSVSGQIKLDITRPVTGTVFLFQ